MEESQDNMQERAKSTLRERLEPVLRAALDWVNANRLKASLLAVACLASIALAAGAWVLLRGVGGSLGPPATIEMALQALDSGAYVRARELAESLRQSNVLPAEELGGPLFVLGAAACREADDTWNKEKEPYYLLAARYLEQARDHGFPPGREAEGLLLLGRSLYRSGRIPAGRQALRLALEANKRKDRATFIHGLLARACFDDANPKLDEALGYNTKYLADNRLSAKQRSEGMLQRCEILFRMGKTEKCLATLGKIPPQAKNKSGAIILQGRVLIREARGLAKSSSQSNDEKRRQANEKYQAAIKVLRRAQGRDTLDNNATRKSIYLIGVCFLESGKPRSALEQFSRTRTLFNDTPETLAADMAEARLLLAAGRNRDALDAYRRVLRVVYDPANFSNPWLSLDELRVAMLEAFEQFTEAREFEMGLRLTRQFHPLFPKVRAMQLKAQAYRQWGDDLLSQADRLAAVKADKVRHKGCLQLRLAGLIHARIARSRITTRHYPDDLWESAGCYFRGQGFDAAARVLKEYLKNESRRRHPQALVMLGEAMLSLNRGDDALAAFRECVEFHPRDAAAYRARLLAAGAYTEKDELEKAESLLRENLEGDLLTPASREWRDSLFNLGKLLHLDGRYQQAINRLEEAVERYPDAQRTIDARYTIALSYRRSARDAREELKKDLVESTRIVRARQVGEFFAAALEQYKRVQEALIARQSETELSTLEKATLANCYFAIGDILFELGRFEEAIKAYSTASNRYQKSPEVLEAYVRISDAYRRLRKPLQARGTLEQAKVVLARMKPDAAFKETTNYTREQWSELLNRLSSL